MDSRTDDLAKVPAITAIFWTLKVLATTLGETGGDAASMTMELGYGVSTLLFGVIFAVAVTGQVLAKRFRPYLYWATIVATTTVGTTLADLVDRSLGIGYAGGSSLLIVLLGLSLLLWKRTTGSLAVANVTTRKAEVFYWVTVMFSQTLGTALGDWCADDVGLGWGYLGAAVVFSAVLVFIAGAWFLTKVSRTMLFWGAFIVTRPLGAAVGDFLDKPTDAGGLGFSRLVATAVLLALIVGLIAVFRQRPARQAH